MADHDAHNELILVLLQIKEKCQDADRLWQVEELVDRLIVEYSDA